MHVSENLGANLASHTQNGKYLARSFTVPHENGAQVVIDSKQIFSTALHFLSQPFSPTLFYM